jgi:hypothetical protein
LRLTPLRNVVPFLSPAYGKQKRERKEKKRERERERVLKRGGDFFFPHRFIHCVAHLSFVFALMRWKIPKRFASQAQVVTKKEEEGVCVCVREREERKKRTKGRREKKGKSLG